MASKFTTPIGKLAWSNIVTITFNLKKEEEWNCALVFPEEQTQEIMANLDEALTNHREKNPSFPQDNSGLHFPYAPSMKKDGAGNKVPEPGMILYKFKRPVYLFRKASQAKERNTAPLVFDSMGRPQRNLAAISPGSEGRVIYDTYVYDKAGQKGVGLQLLGFQVFKLQLDSIKVGAIEGGWVPDDDQGSIPAIASDGSDATEW